MSGTLSQTGMDISQTIGLLTGGYASLRNIESVSSGLVMLSQRLRGIGTDGETIEGMLPKIEADFRRIANIDIRDLNGNLRSTYDIVADMARVFPTLTDMERQFLSEAAIGNRQVRVLNAILANWNDVENAINSANNALGSAGRENAIYLQSLDGRIQQLRSSWQELASAVISSDFIKVLISGMDGLVRVFSAFDGLGGKLIGIPLVLTSITAALKAFTLSTTGSNFLGFFKSIGRLKIVSLNTRRLPQVRPSTCTHVDLNKEPVYAVA